MKKIKKLSIILGVLLLGVIVMSSNADAKKKKTKYIDLSKYVTVKVQYGSHSAPHTYIAEITKYKKNSKFKYNGKKVSSKNFMKMLKTDYIFNECAEVRYKYYTVSGKYIDTQAPAKTGNYIYRVTFNCKGKKYIINKKIKIKEYCYYGSTRDSNRFPIKVIYYKDEFSDDEFNTNDLRIVLPYCLNYNSKVNFKCDYTCSLDKINYDDCKYEYKNIFERNNIKSNQDLYDFIYNNTKDLGELSINRTFTLKRTRSASIKVNMKEQNPNLYNEINKRFPKNMFWRIVKPCITVDVKSIKTGKRFDYGSASFVFTTEETKYCHPISVSKKYDKKLTLDNFIGEANPVKIN